MRLLRVLEMRNDRSSKFQVENKNLKPSVLYERWNQERHVKRQTTENSLSSKFGDDA